MEENFREEEKKVEGIRKVSMEILRETMRSVKSRISKALLDTEEEMKGYITEAYRIDREELRRKKERARRR